MEGVTYEHGSLNPTNKLLAWFLITLVASQSGLAPKAQPFLLNPVHIRFYLLHSLF